MRKLTGNRLANIVIVCGLCLIPLMYSSMLTWAYEAPIDRINRIPAAVVNLDKPARVTGTSDPRVMRVGAELTDQLLAEGKHGFGWTEVDDPTLARKGLEEGTYQALLVIPSELSTNLAALADPKASPHSTTLHLYTNDGVNYLTGTLAQSVSLSLQKAASAAGAKDYISTLLLSLGPMKSGLDEAASGANQLAGGVDRLDHGSDELAAGADRLAAGSDDAASGARRLTVGVDALASGATRLADGAGELRQGVSAYTAGADRIAEGTATLLDGLTRPQGSSPSFTEGLRALTHQLTASDPQTLSGGIAALAEGAHKADGGVDEAHAGAGRLVDGIARAGAGASALQSGAGELRDGAHTLADALSATDPNSLKGGLAQVRELTEGLKVACSILPLDPVCLGINVKLHERGLCTTQLPGEIDKLIAGLDQAGQGAGDLAAGADRLHNGAGELASALHPGTDPSSPTLADGAALLYQATGASPQGQTSPRTLKDATAAIAAGAERLLSGTREAGDGSARLLQALQGRLIPGVTTLRNGSRELADRGPLLLAGTDRAVAGTRELADGARRAQSGSADLSAGLSRLDAGANALAQGSARLADGTKQAGEGAHTLAQRLREGATKVPDLSRKEITDDARVASQPVEVTPTRLNAVSSNGIGFSSFFMALSLYIGGIGIFFVIPSLDVRRSTYEPFWVSAARSAGTAIVFATAQAAAVVLGLELLLDLNAADLWGLIALCVLSSWTFVAMNQACLAVAGFRGRFLSLVLMCLQLGAAAGTFAIETAPTFLQRCNEVLPMGYTVRGIRALTAGAPLHVMPGLAVMLTWLIGSVWATLWAAKRRVGLKPMPFDPALAFPGSAPDDTASLVEAIGREPAGRGASDTPPSVRA